MKKLELLLLEDSREEAKELSLVLQNNNYTVTIAENSLVAQQIIEKQSFDIIILDIMIDGRPEGISFAHKLNQNGIDIPYLFLTSINDKTIFDNAKYTKTFNYLLKPYNELELLYALELAIETHYRQQNTISRNENSAVISSDFIFIKKKNRVEKVQLDAIYYIEVEGKFCSIITIDSKYLIKLSLTKLMTILPNVFLKQVHRNFLININKIKEIYFEDNLIILENKDKIPLSKTYKGDFLDNGIVFK